MVLISKSTYVLQAHSALKEHRLHSHAQPVLIPNQEARLSLLTASHVLPVPFVISQAFLYGQLQ